MDCCTSLHHSLVAGRALGRVTRSNAVEDRSLDNAALAGGLATAWVVGDVYLLEMREGSTEVGLVEGSLAIVEAEVEHNGVAVEHEVVEDRHRRNWDAAHA